MSAQAIGADESLAPDLVSFALTLRDTIATGRAKGSYLPPLVQTAAGSSAQTHLLHLLGRRPRT